MKITYTSILSAICSSILLLGFLSVYIWKKQENYSLYEVKLLIFCTVLTGVRLFFSIDICGISHTIGIKILYPELCRFMRGKIGFLSHFSVLFLISLLGSFLILVQKSLSYISFIKLIKEIRPIEYIRVKKYKKVKKIPILKVDSIEDPFIVGIKNPYIIIPNIDEETKKIVLLHEVGHYIKRDLFLKCFFEILCLLYWWNPLVYIVRYYFSNILEIRNDLIVCNELSEIEKIHYVEILLKMSRTKALKRRGTLSFFNGSFLKIRISSILNEEQKKQADLDWYNCSFDKDGVYGCEVNKAYDFLKDKKVKKRPIVADLKLHAPYFEEDDIVKKNNFFVKTENGYELYMNGTYIGTLDEIPNELKNINIRRK